MPNCCSTYNAPGAMVLGSIFEDECDPYFPKVVQFPEDTVSVKFLFTDASLDEVTYLQGGPEFRAYINAGSAPRPENRELKPVRLLQVDIAIKDCRASEAGWVFGTFVWHGPAKGDTLFDNLVPASLQWGNDPGVYDQLLSESWINQDLKGDPYLGGQNGHFWGSTVEQTARPTTCVLHVFPVMPRPEPRRAPRACWGELTWRRSIRRF